jgi:peptidoglycan L-alanyl-D-glutamate endopeptidase CwlK
VAALISKMKALLTWLNRLFAGSQNGPQPTLPNSSLPSKTSSTPAPSTSGTATSEAKASEWQADPRSEKNIATLEPQTAKLAREHLRRLQAEGLNFKVTSATRTFAEQAALFAKGRTTKGPKVTNARPGSSWHNYGVAYDLTLFSGKNPVWESKHYNTAGRIGKELGLRWGGDFRSIVDRPHFERPLGLTLAEARKRYPTGVVA